jgi:dGTPase
MAVTAEGRIVRIADIMAYLNHDLDDAIRSGVIQKEQVPRVCRTILGETHSRRATSMIRDLIFQTKEVDGQLQLDMSEPVFSAMTRLREFLYENVYRSPKIHREFIKAKKILTELYSFFLDNGDMLHRELATMEMDHCHGPDDSRERVVCDFIASMTDHYALDLYAKIFFPSPLV